LKEGQLGFVFLAIFGELDFYVDLADLKMIFGRLLGTGRFLATVS